MKRQESEPEKRQTKITFTRYLTLTPGADGIPLSALYNLVAEARSLAFKDDARVELKLNPYDRTYVISVTQGD